MEENYYIFIYDNEKAIHKNEKIVRLIDIENEDLDHLESIINLKGIKKIPDQIPLHIAEQLIRNGKAKRISPLEVLFLKRNIKLRMEGYISEDHHRKQLIKEFFGESGKDSLSEDEILELLQEIEREEMENLKDK